MVSPHERDRQKVSGDRTREELIFAVLSLPVECDPRLKNLVWTLNDLPDVYTCSSCGGHTDPEKRDNPAPEGYFYIQFIAEPTEAGFLWSIHPGSNRLELRTVNQFGVTGPVSTVEIEQ